MTFNRIENKLVRLADHLTHVVLGHRECGNYLRLCGGYMLTLNSTAAVEYPTCLFCWRRISTDVLR